MTSADSSILVNRREETSGAAVKGHIKLEDGLNIRDLLDLKDAFLGITEGRSEKISYLEFREACQTILGSTHEEQLKELYLQVDVAGEGHIDWDMFCSHLLRQFYEKDDKMKATKVPQWQRHRPIGSPHKETVQHIDILQNPKRYITISKEGMIGIWDMKMKMTNTLKVESGLVKSRNLWITSMAVLHNLSHKIAIASTSKEIMIYDLQSKKGTSCTCRIQGLPYAPLSLHYWSSQVESILCYGDVHGNVTAFLFDKTDSPNLFEPTSRPSSDSDGEDVTEVPYDKILAGHYEHVKVVTHRGHSGWTRKVMYAPHLDLIISCSTTSTNSLVLGMKEKNKTLMRTTSFNVPQGVNCFDYNPHMNIIATGDVDLMVRLWNPYVKKPVGVLGGHMTSVTHVILNGSRGQLISLSMDKTFRIWDVQRQACLQRLTGILAKGPDVLYSPVPVTLLFDEPKNRLIMSSNNLLSIMDMKPEMKDRILSHEKPITCTKYIGRTKQIPFYQVSSACQGSTITLWNIDTGQKLKQITNAHGESEITAMVIDLPSKLLSGSSDGTIKIWDINTTACHRVLQAGREGPVDILQVLCIKRRVIAVGWERDICVFRDKQLMSSDFNITPDEWSGRREHSEDIMCAAYHAPGYLATASANGEIVLWNPNSENKIMKLDSRSSQAMKTQSTVEMLLILEARLENPEAAALVTCGQNGWVRFWNVHKGSCEGEFVAHPNVDSITMAVDPDNHLLVTADTSGEMKTWLIEGFCDGTVLEEDAEPLLKPVLYRSWTGHGECITEVEVCVRGNRVVIVTASSDCSLKLWAPDGMCIGTFGQEEHWKLESIEIAPVPTVQSVLAELQEEESIISEVTEEEGLEEDFIVDVDEDMSTADFDPSYSYETWNCTILGKSYANQRSQKRPRRQPHNYARLPQVGADQRPISGTQMGGPSQVLKVSDLDSIGMPQRPDFMMNPHKYFSDGFSDIQSKGTKLPPLSSADVKTSLKFDEKSLFPKHLLEASKESTAVRGRRNKPGGKAGSSTRASSSSNNKTPTILPRLRATAF